MQNNELETIAATMQEALHRAYALGRNDALRRVVEIVQSDELGSKTVALLSHSEPPAAEASHNEVGAIAPPNEVFPDDTMHRDAMHKDAMHKDRAHGDGAHNDNAEAVTPGQEQSKPPVSVKDFLLDYLYPLGAKK